MHSRLFVCMPDEQISIERNSVCIFFLLLKEKAQRFNEYEWMRVCHVHPVFPTLIVGNNGNASFPFLFKGSFLYKN